MVPLLLEHSDDKNTIDPIKAMKMALLHDVVEIDAGDTFCYDDGAHHDKEEREQLAATRIFGLLPVNQSNEFRSLWDEYELNQTPEAKFVHALDCLHPLLLNYQNGGGSWLKHGIYKHQVEKRIAKIANTSPSLYQFALSLIHSAHLVGILK
jgi:putative hydrolases of HD superfamily